MFNVYFQILSYVAYVASGLALAQLNVPNLIGRQHANYADLASNTGRGRTMKRLEANTDEKNPGQKVGQPPSPSPVCAFVEFSPRRGEKLVSNGDSMRCDDDG